MLFSCQVLTILFFLNTKINAEIEITRDKIHGSYKMYEAFNIVNNIADIMDSADHHEIPQLIEESYKNFLKTNYLKSSQIIDTKFEILKYNNNFLLLLPELERIDKLFDNFTEILEHHHPKYDKKDIFSENQLFFRHVRRWVRRSLDYYDRNFAEQINNNYFYNDVLYVC